MLSFSLPILVAQEVAPVEAAPDLAAHLDYPENRVLDLKSSEGKFELVELAPTETVLITVIWPTRLPDGVLSIDAMDGGTIDFGSSGSVQVNPDGATQITFLTPGEPGEYRLKLRSEETFWEMPFFVPDPAAPENNPGALKPQPVEPPPVTEPTP